MLKVVKKSSHKTLIDFFKIQVYDVVLNSQLCLTLNHKLIAVTGAAIGGQGMSEEDSKVCMVDDMDNLSPLAEAYARARGMTNYSIVQNI